MVSAASVNPHPILEGVDTKKLPELGAYVETGRRSGADTALLLADAARPEGRPMLATWRYGLGKAGVITTDFSEGWGGAWASSPQAAQVLKQTVRFLLRQHDAHRADAEVHIRDRVVEVAIELPPDAPDSAAPRSIDVFAIEKSGTSRKLTMRLEQRGPGRFVARGRSAGEPIIIVRARDARGALMAEAVGREDRTPELSGVGADMVTAAELARLGDGRLQPASVDTLRPTRRPAKELTATWPYALIVASMLVVVDLVLRRLGTKRRRDPKTLGARSPIAPQMA
jgi:Ca-activated chloride channel family protein